MRANIELIGASKYTTKDGRQGTRICYRFMDKECMGDGSRHLRGYSDQNIFVDGHGIFDKLPLDWFGKQNTIEYEEQPLPGNPLRKRTVVTKLNDLSLV